MNRVGSMFLGGLENAFLTQIAFGRSRGSDMLRFIGHANVQRAAIGVGKNGDAAYAHVAQRADDAYGNLAAVGDQDSAKHAW